MWVYMRRCCCYLLLFFCCCREIDFDSLFLVAAHEGMLFAHECKDYSSLGYLERVEIRGCTLDTFFHLHFELLHFCREDNICSLFLVPYMVHIFAFCLCVRYAGVVYLIMATFHFDFTLIWTESGASEIGGRISSQDIRLLTEWWVFRRRSIRCELDNFIAITRGYETRFHCIIRSWSRSRFSRVLNSFLLSVS